MPMMKALEIANNASTVEKLTSKATLKAQGAAKQPGQVNQTSVTKQA